MAGQEPGKDGVPGTYKMIDLEEIELYNVVNDPGETKNVANKNPKVVEKIKLLANTMRSRLGDSLLGLGGSETREAGSVD